MKEYQIKSTNLARHVGVVCFLCPRCKKKVERDLYDGRRNKSCGCTQVIGKGSMEFIRFLGYEPSKAGHGRIRMALFRCPLCKKEVARQYYNGINQNSCGCLRHGYCRDRKKHPLYGVWADMRNRCYLSNRKVFYRYGGRGIAVCEEWQHSPKTFIEWALANGWQDGLELDRIDNDDGYKPSNCRFVTSAVNAQNRSTTKLDATTVQAIRQRYQHGDLKDMSYKEIGALFGVSFYTIFDILKGRSWKNLA